MPKRPLPAEIAIQSGFISALRYIAPQVHFFAVPNGIRTTEWGARRARQEGMKAGAPDLYIYWPGGDCWLEFKSAKGRIDENQREMHERLSRCGKAVAVVRSIDEAVDFVRQCGAPVTGRLPA